MICGGRGVEHIGPVAAGGRRDSHEDLLRVGSNRVAEEDIEMALLEEEVADIGLGTTASPVEVAIDEGALAGGAAGYSDMEGRLQRLLCCRYTVRKGIHAACRHLDMVVDCRP